MIPRRVRPTRRHLKKLTAFEQKAGWRYCITATNIRRMWGIAGSDHSQFLDVLHRSHAGVEDRVRTNKAMGLDNLPSASWEINRGWTLTANIAADLDAWVRLLALHDIGLADAEPDTMRFRPYRLPARLAGSGSLPSRPSPDGRTLPRQGPARRRPAALRTRGTRRTRGVTRRRTSNDARTLRANYQAGQRSNLADESRLIW
ncbi:hypothetical protein ACH4YO_41260 [Streptomyces noursei]|uniref:hypothetical protein n=1 Tax=Streptomyces noursei TaxID=1971 RepID=UPI0033D073FD